MKYLLIFFLLSTLLSCASVEHILLEEEKAALDLPYIQTGNNRKNPVVGYKVIELYSRYGKPTFSLISIEGKRILVYSPEAIARGGDEPLGCNEAFTLNKNDYVVDHHCR